MQPYTRRELGQGLLRNQKPLTAVDIREIAPLTMQSDYLAHLGERNEDWRGTLETARRQRPQLKDDPETQSIAVI